MYLMMFLAPGNDLNQYGHQVNPLTGELIKNFSFAIWMLPSEYNARTFQHSEPVGKNIGGYLLFALQEITVGGFALENHIPDNKQRPFIPENIEGGAYRAVRSVGYLFRLQTQII